ncbi:hypothetical protein BofuT4_uP041420.1 [Botrytis cinerea T4]|uniref:Uncharacterized protein n=1 Tax=Botryotinia fuckeliana (strain T4) TaxID=999810 RepID=G2Y1J1_BOTF4|nr:hypothetical protein BofuT4_uP041420.1 [Botrytis cinerea T4]
MFPDVMKVAIALSLTVNASMSNEKMMRTLVHMLERMLIESK